MAGRGGLLAMLHGLTLPTETGASARAEAWREVDPNGSGHASLAEVDGWLKVRVEYCLKGAPMPGADMAGVDMGIDGLALWAAYRPMFIVAFNDAADSVIDAGVNKFDNVDYVQLNEFRLLCVVRLFPS